MPLTNAHPVFSKERPSERQAISMHVEGHVRVGRLSRAARGLQTPLFDRLRAGALKGPRDAGAPPHFAHTGPKLALSASILAGLRSARGPRPALGLRGGKFSF